MVIDSNSYSGIFRPYFFFQKYFFFAENPTKRRVQIRLWSLIAIPIAGFSKFYQTQLLGIYHGNYLRDRINDVPKNFSLSKCVVSSILFLQRDFQILSNTIWVLFNANAFFGIPWYIPAIFLVWLQYKAKMAFSKPFWTLIFEIFW